MEFCLSANAHVWNSFVWPVDMVKNSAKHIQTYLETRKLWETSSISQYFPGQAQGKSKMFSFSDNN